jgi:colicin import membrane protein
MQDRERSPSESYFWPVIWAVALHVVIFAALFVSWAMAPELPQSRPIVQAKLVQLKSKSPAQVQTEQKLAGEAKKTSARQYEVEQMEQRKAEQQEQAAAAAAAKAAEQKKAEDARKAQQVEAAQKAAEAKAEAAKAEAAEKAEKAAQEKAAADEQRKSALAKKQAEEEAKKKAAAEEAKKKAAEEAKKKAAEDAQKKAAEAAEKKAVAEDAKKKAAEDAKKKAAEQAKAKAAEDAKKKAAQAAARKAAEEKKAQALAELLSDDTQRQQALADEVGDEVASNFDDLIVRLVSEQWRRPPSARNGMSVEVQIDMLPDGTVTSANVTRSSGDSAFDSSAVAAVRNVGRIPEMQQLDRATFDQLYRKRRIIFKPEDLSL